MHNYHYQYKIPFIFIKISNVTYIFPKIPSDINPFSDFYLGGHKPRHIFFRVDKNPFTIFCNADKTPFSQKPLHFPTVHEIPFAHKDIAYRNIGIF